MNYRFDKEAIQTHDIFYAEHYDIHGVKYGHYFYCIHTQREDKNNTLFRDVIGLLITTRDVPGYTHKIIINNKEAFVCCDKEVRFPNEVGVINNKFFKIDIEDRKKVMEQYKKMCKEKIRQMKGGLKK